MSGFVSSSTCFVCRQGLRAAQNCAESFSRVLGGPLAAPAAPAARRRLFGGWPRGEGAACERRKSTALKSCASLHRRREPCSLVEECLRSASDGSGKHLRVAFLRRPLSPQLRAHARRSALRFVRLRGKRKVNFWPPQKRLRLKAAVASPALTKRGDDAVSSQEEASPLPSLQRRAESQGPLTKSS